jgi:hypothetical protein
MMLLLVSCGFLQSTFLTIASALDPLENRGHYNHPLDQTNPASRAYKHSMEKSWKTSKNFYRYVDFTFLNGTRPMLLIAPEFFILHHTFMVMPIIGLPQMNMMVELSLLEMEILLLLWQNFRETVDQWIL